MKPIILAVAAVALIVTFAGRSWAADDLKGISGYGCFPQSGKYRADFFFGGGAIVNKSESSRNVVCTIFRDKYGTTEPAEQFSGDPDPITFPDSGKQVDAVSVYFQRDSAAGTNSLVCQLLIRDLTTGVVNDSSVAGNETTVGFGSLLLTGVQYASAHDVIYLFCILPAKSRIVGLRWEEDVDGLASAGFNIPQEGNGENASEGLVDDGSRFLNPFPNSLDQAAFNSSTQAYEYGFDSIDNIRILDAPVDTDYRRWAMLHDGTTYRLYFMKRGSERIMYQFVFSGDDSVYRYGRAGQLADIPITGFPNDADPSSFAMLHDGADYRLYRRSRTDPDLLYQGAFNATDVEYQYGFNSIPSIAVTNAPADTNRTGWAILHDGASYRLYFRRDDSSTTLYQFRFNGATYDNVPGFNVTGMPANNIRDNFGMLHDGARYRFYFTTDTERDPDEVEDLPPVIPDPPAGGELQSLMLSAWSCLQREDTSHFLFHGCFDWHSAVHGHWAVLRYGNVEQVTPEVAAVIERLQSPALADEREFMDNNANFEMPYGRAWFLALAIEYERRVDDGAVAAMADDIAASLRAFLDARTIDPLIREYGNHTWALTQLLRFYRYRGDADGESWVNNKVDATYLTYDSRANPTIDLTRPDFFSLWGNWAHLLGLRDPAALANWLSQQTIPDDALVPIGTANSSHQLGMNPSRAWGLWWIAEVSTDPRFAEALAEHRLEISETHAERQNDYGAYGHWVPQFAIYANTQPTE